jgi:transcription antitermination factor NusG
MRPTATATAARPELHPGARVVLLCGPFAGSAGRVMMVNDRSRRVRVEVTIDGTRAAVELRWQDVEARR